MRTGNDLKASSIEFVFHLPGHLHTGILADTIQEPYLLKEHTQIPCITFQIKQKEHDKVTGLEY